MTAPTLTNTSGVVFTFNDGDVETIDSNIQANPDFDAMPMSTPDSALLFDVNGTQKTITMRGSLSNSGTNRLSSGTAVTINAQRQWLEQNINGNQTGLTLSSNYTSTWNGIGWYDSTVLVGSIRFTEQEGNPAGLVFEISLLIGAI